MTGNYGKCNLHHSPQCALHRRKSAVFPLLGRPRAGTASLMSVPWTQHTVVLRPLWEGQEGQLRRRNKNILTPTVPGPLGPSLIERKEKMVLAMASQPAQMSLVRSPCTCCLGRPKLKPAEFGAKKGLLIKKVPTEKMGAPLIPQIHLKETHSSGFFYVKGRGSGKGNG